jgi:hypothetical protein
VFFFSESFRINPFQKSLDLRRRLSLSFTTTSGQANTTTPPF